MKLLELVEVSQQVANTRSRREKTARISAYFKTLPHELMAVAASYLAGEVPQGKVGVGYALLQKLNVSPSQTPSLLLSDVDAAFTRVKAEAGAGSGTRRQELLAALLGRATAAEQTFLVRLLIGELRQGALEALVVEAVAQAFGIAFEKVRRAVMFAGGVPPVAAALAHQGESGLAGFDLRLFDPVQPMLADTAADVDAALERLGEAAFDYKMDGVRVQVHKDGNEVQVYSRALNKVTGAVPEIVQVVQGLGPKRLVLDGEALAFAADGRPLPFQVTMKRLGRKVDVEAMQRSLPLSMKLFDVLHVDGETVIDQPLQERWKLLRDITQGQHLVPPLGDLVGAGSGRIFIPSDARRPRGCHGEVSAFALRRRPPRAKLAKAQAYAHVGSRGAGGGVGQRASRRVAQQLALGRARSEQRWLRDVGQDVQRDDRRDLALAD